MFVWLDLRAAFGARASAGAAAGAGGGVQRAQLAAGAASGAAAAPPPRATWDDEADLWEALTQQQRIVLTPGAPCAACVTAAGGAARARC
jgi:hypothetical protein